MGRYFEAGLARALHGSARHMGRTAASEARSRLKGFDPSLALVFVSAEIDVEEVNRGIREILHDCPTIGTSTAGEICNGPVKNGVVVALLASPHLRVRVGTGNHVSKDFRAAVHQALGQAEALDYLDPSHAVHQMMSVSAPGMPGVSSKLMIVFSPGATNKQPSLSHDIHTMLRRNSANRIPIFGGSSGDYLRFESNYQIVNGSVFADSIALAFIESEVMFGMGLAHGFSPTRKGALVTRASDHIVYELDRRPAAEVCAEIIGIPIDILRADTLWFSDFPFGTTDVYGNSIIQVPERILEDGSVQFAPIMNIDQVITLMSSTESVIAQAGLSAYKKAIRQAGLRKPALALMSSCALRERLVGGAQREIDPIRTYSSVPLGGFYTFGEKGLSDDGLPVYCNQSVSMLVFSDELNPVAALVNRGATAYREFSERLQKKEHQIKAIGRINQVIQGSSEPTQLLHMLIGEITELLPWTDVAFYLSKDGSGAYTRVSASDEDAFLPELTGAPLRPGDVPIWMESAGKPLGLMLMKSREARAPEEDEVDLAQTIAQMTASGLHRLELDARLDLKLRHLAILNRLGKELSKAVSLDSPSHHILAYLRRGLNLSLGSLWLIDHTSQLLVKEAFDAAPEHQTDSVVTANDARIAKWQMGSSRPLFYSPSGGEDPVELISPFSYSFVSIPIESKGKLRGILNLYSTEEQKGWLRPDRVFETMDLLASLAAQIAVFLENLSLQKHSTLYTEVHHRIKNNLHNIAGLLRMQVRRLDRISAEQALDDSIARIVSIAKVHETLSQGDIGMIDLGPLTGRISTLSLPEGPENPVVSIDVSGSPILVPSKEATSVALVINELVRNAVQHGMSATGGCTLTIRLTLTDGLVTLIIEDHGPGLPDGFDPERDGNLGLSIVRTLVREELKGEFVIEGSHGTMAKVSFPLPVGQQIQ